MSTSMSATPGPSASVSASAWPVGRSRRKYTQTICQEFCSFSVVIPSDPEAPDQVLPVAVKWDKVRNQLTAWHVIPSAMSDEVNLTGSDFEFQNEKEAVLAQYFCANIMKTVGKLEGELIDGLWEVPVPVNCLQGLRREMTDEARSFIELESLPGCQTAMEYLNDKGWWEVAQPVDTATDMVDLIQPLLSCESWDWHAASTARVLMKWASLLSIVAMDETPAESWQKAHSDYLSHMPFASTLEGSPKGHPWNVNIRYIRGSVDMIDSTQIERNTGKLKETFSNLRAAKPLQVPTRQTTADAVMVLHGVQVVTAEVKSSSDKNDAGFNQQALLMTFLRAVTRSVAPLAISLHMNASKICLQTLELDKKNGGGYETMMRRKVYHTEG